MVSSTQQTERVRARQHKNAGKRRKRQMRMGKTTPTFPVHPAGYDQNAADAKPAGKKD
jgi:hypothetical protein